MISKPWLSDLKTWISVGISLILMGTVIASITTTLNGYVDDMVGFTGDGKGTRIVTSEMIKGKEMQLGIPFNTSADQMAAIAQSVLYAQTQGIKIIVTKVK